MTDTYSPVLEAKDLIEGQAIPATNENERGRRFEQGGQHFSVLDKDLTAPPGSPADGDAYIVATGATGAWAGKAKSIAYYQVGTGWLFIAPRAGFTAYAYDEDASYRYRAGDWTVVSAASSGGLLRANNLSDLISAATARGNLSVYSQAQTDSAIAAAIAALIASAPGALDTLDELAAALGDDANFASTVTTALAGKLGLGGGTLSGALHVPDDAYDATSWNGSTEAPTKNAVRDKIEAVLAAAYTDEMARDAIGAALVAGKGIAIAVDDAGDTISISQDQPIVTDATTARTLVLSDRFKYLRLTHASGCAVTVPPNSSVAFAVGDVVTLRTTASAASSVVAGVGVTLNKVGGGTGTQNFAEIGATVQLKKVATDEWDIIGGVA